ncbi:MAG: S8 family serine peptidase, partial [Bradymonadaceae bacterium]
GDEAIAVGDLRPFSGRGPRIDGAPVIDIAAPDNPFVPIAATPRVVNAGWGRNWIHLFGGTSDAAPHVAG